MAIGDRKKAEQGQGYHEDAQRKEDNQRSNASVFRVQLEIRGFELQCCQMLSRACPIPRLLIEGIE